VSELKDGPELVFDELMVRAGWHRAVETFGASRLALIGAAASVASIELLDRYAFSGPPSEVLETVASSSQLFAQDRDRGWALWQDEPRSPVLEYVTLPSGWLPSDPEKFCPDGHPMPRDTGVSPDWFWVTLRDAFDHAGLRYGEQWDQRAGDCQSLWPTYFDTEYSDLRRCTERCGWLFFDGHYLAPPDLAAGRA